MNTPIVTEIRRNGNPVGERVELARYTVPGAGTRILYGQRVDGVAFCRRTLSFSTPHWGPARTAGVVLVSRSKRTEVRAPQDGNEQTNDGGSAEAPTPRRPGAVAPAPAWSWRGTP
jgi:hypothetical protein